MGREPAGKMEAEATSAPPLSHMSPRPPDLAGALLCQVQTAGCRFRNDVIQGIGGKQILLDDPSGISSMFQPNTAQYRAKIVSSTQR
jgi:hypothetical protein